MTLLLHTALQNGREVPAWEAEQHKRLVNQRTSRARIGEPNFPRKSQAVLCSDPDGRAAPTRCQSI